MKKEASKRRRKRNLEDNPASDGHSEETKEKMRGPRPSLQGKNNPAWVEKVKVECDNCGKILKRRPKKVKNQKHHFCNKKCMFEWMKENNPMKDPEVAKKFKGKGNPMYGISPRERMDRETYKKWLKNNRKSILKGLHRRPSDIEEKVIKVINEYDFPFEYTGDGEKNDR